ncbi:tautomerase family protein [Streptomyces sp. NPDC046985]|uniref:tautomerase family protein n=1 Tax=Streptomyces sp. NPDC046985 TaxID=3155377 RepID=UPI0033C228FC
MPLWHIYHPADAYTPEDKERIAKDVTDVYARIGLPRFYVVTLFHQIEADSYYVGGEPTDKTVRVVIEHIARQLNDPALRKATGEKLNAVLAPYTTDRDLYLEFHIDETPRDLWMTGGIWPPPAGSEAERLWAKENRPVPYESPR